MGYGDNRYGDRGDRFGGGDRWRDRDRDEHWNGIGRDEDRSRSERGYGRGRDWSSGSDWGRSDHDWDRNRGGDNDRGFMERAGEKVRSWFSDDDDDYGRSRGREHGSRSDWGRGGERFGGGFGNQRGWGDDHFDREREQGRSERSGSDRYADSDSGYGGGGGGADSWGGSGFGGGTNSGRRFDRVDPGHVGAQGAHPMSAPVGGAYGAGFGGGSSARSAAILRNERGGGRDRDEDSRARGMGGNYDPHYSQWRQRQMEQLDHDYEEYCRENQSRFEQEFGGWRQKRQSQRQLMGRVTEQMKVVGSDGEHVGTVDKVRGDRIILTKSDPGAGGVHHSIPCSWVERVEDEVRLNKSAEEAMNSWRNEDHSRALFEREDQGSEGPHVLNRSFAGTYRDEEEDKNR